MSDSAQVVSEEAEPKLESTIEPKLDSKSEATESKPEPNLESKPESGPENGSSVTVEKVNGSSPAKKRKQSGNASLPNGDNHDEANGEDEGNSSGSRRSSPRKAAITARAAAAAAQDISDEDDDDIQEVVVKAPKPVKKPMDEKERRENLSRMIFGTLKKPARPEVSKIPDGNESSDSIVELDDEDPLADPLSIKPEAEKTKPPNGEKIVTLDSVAAIQNLAKQQLPKEEAKVTIIDPSKILAGKTVGGVTITPAPALSRSSPSGTPTNLGFGVSISRTTKLPSSTTISPMSTGFTSRGLGYASVSTTPPATLTPTSISISAEKQPALQADPNLTDDMFVLEAPSFIVPYVYEKPPKETFKDFKISVKKLAAKEIIKKEEGTDKEENDKEKKEKEDTEEEKDKDEEGTEEDDDDDETKKEKQVKAGNVSDDDDVVEEVKDDTKKASGNYFETTLGKFLIDLGMNMVQEFVQEDLLKELTKKSHRDKSASMMHSIASLKNNLETSKKRNEGFHFELIRCQRCSFQTESQLALANHQEFIHVRGGGFYRCSYCRFDTMHSHEVVAHMMSEHNVAGKLERPIPLHQCPQCPWEDNNKGKLTRHRLACDKRFRPEKNQEPNYDFEPPAKMPKVVPFSRNLSTVRPSVATPSFNGVGNSWPTGTTASLINSQQQFRNISQFSTNRINITGIQPGYRQIPGASMALQRGGTGVLMTNQAGNRIQLTGNSAALLSSLASNSSVTIQSISQRQANPGFATQQNRVAQPRQQQGSAGFVVCEICDGYIKDLEQLKNHMNWIHKIKIHPKMIHQRPPLNCQKCQFRFFTDQGLERHLLGTHGLVTASMQDLATKGQDSGRCPICGKVYQWKLLNHVAKDHQKTLKPAHLSYKCTVCEATFCQYKLFESHVYATHGAGSKKAPGEKEESNAESSSAANDNATKKIAGKSLLKSKNAPDDVIELDDEEMEVDEDSVQSIPEKSEGSNSSVASITKKVADDHDDDDDDEVEPLSDDDDN